MSARFHAKPYQFETIHPFLDGNGRIGRLLITLYLVDKGLLKKPSLYLSDFFERNRSSYYDALTRVRESNDLIHWVKFFLSAVIETASKGKETFQSILRLRQEMDTLVLGMGRRAENAQQLLSQLYKRPSTTVHDVSELLGISPTAATNLIKQLQSDGVLREITGYQRNRVYLFERYITLFGT